MRVISKIQDYYDGYMNYNKKDRFNKVWIRKEEDVKVNKNKLKIFEDKSLRLRVMHWESGYLVIAGEVYPYIRFCNYEESIFFFDVDEAFKVYKKAYDNEKKRAYYYWNEANKKDFVEFFDIKERFDELCIELDSPILLIQPTHQAYKKQYSSLRAITKNMNIKEFGATNIMHAATIYQMLDNFVSNAMVDDEMPSITPMSEKEKMQQFGFTHDYSFRKEPSKNR